MSLLWAAAQAMLMSKPCTEMALFPPHTHLNSIWKAGPFPSKGELALSLVALGSGEFPL